MRAGAWGSVGSPRTSVAGCTATPQARRWGAPGWIWAQWGQRDAGDGAPVQLAGPGRGATEPLADLPEGTAGAAVQAIAKPGHQPLPGGVQALHGGGEGIGEHRRERPGVVDPLLGDPGSDRHAEGLEAG